MFTYVIWNSFTFLTVQFCKLFWGSRDYFEFHDTPKWRRCLKDGWVPLFQCIVLYWIYMYCFYSLSIDTFLFIHFLHFPSFPLLICFITWNFWFSFSWELNLWGINSPTVAVTMRSHLQPPAVQGVFTNKWLQ